MGGQQCNPDDEWVDAILTEWILQNQACAQFRIELRMTTKFQFDS